MNGVTSYFEVRTPTQEDCEDQNTFNIELKAEAPPWDLSGPEYSCQEQRVVD